MTENKETEIEWESWGVYSIDGKEHQKNPDICPYCDYTLSLFQSFHSFLVGFSEQYNLVFFECPKCFEIFYRHKSPTELHFLERCVKDKPDFFQVPGVREAILRIIEKRKNK